MPVDFFGRPIVRPLQGPQLDMFNPAPPSLFDPLLPAGPQADPVVPAPAGPKVNRYYRHRPWHVETAADRKIARKFAKCVTPEMF